MLVSRLKTEADFNSAPFPVEGKYLRFIKDNGDGTFTEYIKDHTGNVQELTHGTNIVLAKVTGTVTETTAVVRPFKINELGEAVWDGDEVTAYWKLEGPAT